MIELLLKLGVPTASIVAAMIFGTLLWKYFNHRLSIQAKKFEKELELIQSIHKERFQAIDNINHYLEELSHNLFHIAAALDDDFEVTSYVGSNVEKRIEVTNKLILSIRTLVRERNLILGDKLKLIAYEATDYVSEIISGGITFDEKEWALLRENLKKKCDEILRTIPKVANAIVGNSISSKY